VNTKIHQDLLRCSEKHEDKNWIPAFAGMTRWVEEREKIFLEKVFRENN